MLSESTEEEEEGGLFAPDLFEVELDDEVDNLARWPCCIDN